MLKSKTITKPVSNKKKKKKNNYVALIITCKIVNKGFYYYYYALSYISAICHNKFVILTDARSALQHVARSTSNFRGSLIAYNILKTIQYLKQLNKHVILQWIPSNVGISGNEIVDDLAREATHDGISLSIVQCFSDLFPVLREHVRKIWVQHYEKNIAG